MSYFPEDIPFMSKEELRENGIRIPKDATDTNVGDTISRQAARHALCKAVHKGEDVPCENQTASCLWTGTRVCDFVREIDALPSAQPEPHEGHWIDKGWNGDWGWQIDGHGNCWRVIECSECGKRVFAESNYCPHCGAKMKGAEHETD